MQSILKRGLIQAPLAGYSCAPFRLIAQKYGQPDYTCTEMLSAHPIYSKAPQRKRYIYKDPQEKVVCVQLSGNNPEILKSAAQIAEAEYGASLIDLNCGCPMPKVRKKTQGSKLLESPELLFKMINQMKESISIPLTVKIRIHPDLDLKENSLNPNIQIAKLIESAGADGLIVHGRSWEGRYDTPVNFNQIKYIKNNINIPVIGNGDVKDLESAQKMLNTTHCDGLMIARASVGQPWLFNEIDAGLNNKIFIKPTLKQIGEIFLEHVQGMIELEGEYLGLLEMRKTIKYYTRDLVPQSCITELMKIVDYESFERCVLGYFQ